MGDVTGSLEIRWIQGFSNKHLKFVDNKTVCYTCGSHICFLNLETKTQSVFQSPGRGVSVLTANGHTRIFAFSEQKLTPSIFVYIFPQLQLKSELKGGAQLDYTYLTLSHGGPYLGSCSSFPDYKITIWNWENAVPLCAQHGQDVISLTFDPTNWCQLCALGKSSLTVWNIEKSASFHVLKPSVIELPAKDGSLIERVQPTSHTINKSPQRNYFGPDMPPSAIVGPRADKAENILTKSRVSPTAICWSTTSDLYVGCEEGFLLLADPESLSVSILFSPINPDAIPELRQSNFQTLTLNRNGLIVVGKDSMVHNLYIKEAEIEIRQTWQLDGPVTTVMSSPDKETLLFSSDTGQIFMSHATSSENVVKILDALSGNFVAAAMLQSDQNICVSVKESGELQLWSRDGICLSSMSLQVEVSSLACCPIALYAALGTASGTVLFIDMNKPQQPRLVHKVNLYRRPVDHLVFDQGGLFLFTGALDRHVYVLNAKPSRRFSVIGYMDVLGTVLSLSTYNFRESEQVKVLALCSGQEGKTHDGNLLTLFNLSAMDLAVPGCINRHGCLSADILKVSRYELPHPVRVCVLGMDGVFAYCHRRKTLQQFQLPRDIDSQSSNEMVQLKTVQEVKGHPLGPAFLALSPHNLLLASGGRDGLLCIHDTAIMKQHAEQQCHSYRHDGVRSVSFSADSKTLLTTGSKDCSLVCTDVRIQGLDANKTNMATLYRRSIDSLSKNIFQTENPALTGLSELSQDSLTKSGKVNVDVTEQNDGYNRLLAALSSDSTWQEKREEEVLKEDNQQYFEMKENLKKQLQEMRDTIQDMIHINENIPEIEQLELQEFNLDIEEQKRLDATVLEEVAKVRNEVELEIAERCFLYDVIKRECWDSMEVKGKAVEAFHADHVVSNFPFKERTENELEDLQRVESARILEMADDAEGETAPRALPSDHEKSGQKESAKTMKVVDEDQEEESLIDSYSAQLGCSNPYLYNQFSLNTTEQKMNQIILLKDVIYRVKTAFNKEFDMVHRQKVQEINRVRDRNRQIEEILVELEMNMDLWEPKLTQSEWPERLFEVDESEIKAEKYLTPEQKKEEERKRLEEQKRLAAETDNVRLRALDDMMDGVLEVKKEDFLKVEIPLPDFVETKPNTDWSEEEKKAYKDYELKVEELNEEKEKYRKLMESEMKKLQTSIKDSTEQFDETLKRLFEKKIKCEIAIYQEEFKITYLLYSVQMEAVMRNREKELKLKLQKMMANKEETGEAVRKQEQEVQLFQEIYESTAAEDKVLDKEFRKDFSDVPKLIVDHLYKLFKHRPRSQKRKSQTSSIPKPSQLHGPDGELLSAMEALDSPENMPEGLNPSIWERFCVVRRTKAASEQKVRVKGQILAEMQEFLQRRRDDDKVAQEEIKNLTDEIESLEKEKDHFLMDTMIQTLLKQDQVEVTADPTPDFSDSVLLHRSVVEDLNTTIRTHGDHKIATMVETKDLRKGIIKQEWENKMKMMEIEDLKKQARDIQMLRLTEDQKEYLTRTDRDCRVTKQVSTLRENIAFHEKIHQKDVQQRKQNIKHLHMQALMKTEKSAELEQQIKKVEVTVAEMREKYEAAALADNIAGKTEVRYQEVLERRRLRDTVRAQMEELSFLSAEVQRLRMKNFPSLDQLPHK